MPSSFLSSEEYDDHAHRYFDAGDYDAALASLKEGLDCHPDAVELHVGLGYTRLAREEIAWAKHAFERALELEPEHEDALVGLGEVLLQLGQRARALELFARVRHGAQAGDLDLLLSIGRALYRERLFDEARMAFSEAVDLHPHSAEAAAAYAYALHRAGEVAVARRQLRRALRLDPGLHEARVYLGHLLYDLGEWSRALAQFERIPAAEHTDALALWRVLELKRALFGSEAGDPAMAAWEARLEELETELDPLDELLLEIEGEAAGPDGGYADDGDDVHRVRTADGQRFGGSWVDIVRQLRDAGGAAGESIAQFMRRRSEEERARSGIAIPCHDPEAFVRASARAGHLRIEC
jgi:Tfp pilus assembly protein PilF